MVKRHFVDIKCKECGDTILKGVRDDAVGSYDLVYADSLVYKHHQKKHRGVHRPIGVVEVPTNVTRANPVTIAGAPRNEPGRYAVAKLTVPMTCGHHVLLAGQKALKSKDGGNGLICPACGKQMKPYK